MTSLPIFGEITQGITNAFGDAFIVILIALFALLIMYFALTGNLLISLAMALLPFSVLGLTTDNIYSSSLLGAAVVVFALLLALALGRLLFK